MANASLVITLSTPLSVAQLANYVKSSSDAHGECRSLSHLFHRLDQGINVGAFDVQTSANAPVKASGTITLTYASISNNDTITVAGVTLTCVTGTPSGAQFKKQTDAPTTAANLAALINSNTTTNKLVSAAAASGVVTVTSLVNGAVGNFITLATSNSGGFALSAAVLANGAGGAETVAVNYVRN